MALVTTLPKRSLALALAAGALLALPVEANAAVTFGSRLSQNPANSGECIMVAAPCTIVSRVFPTDPVGDPYADGAPMDGVISRVRVRGYGDGTPATVTFGLANVRLSNPPNTGEALATKAGTGPNLILPIGDTDTPVTEVPARVSVRRGNQLALDGTNFHATYNSGGDQFSYYYAPPLVDGQGERGSNGATGELLVQVVIEPDADRDGFGDETQDRCPGAGGPNDGCPVTTQAPGPTVRCAGRIANIVGTNGPNRITGTSRSDVIATLGGNDRVRAGRGNDIVCAGSGNDRVHGGSGRDGLDGGNGNDRVSGGSGNDRIAGGRGRDRISGGAGRDRLSGGSGRDRCIGGANRDSALGCERNSSI